MTARERTATCVITEIAKDRSWHVESEAEGAELPRSWLFQGLPKSDKMELIIQKAVELGRQVICRLPRRMRW
ncbi:MAG: 16S rRNA (uracil(1498)-N(3))-methyltransferase [Lachnospiraceae bacterium]